MANKNIDKKSSKKKVNEEVHEPVTNRDQSEEVVANSSQSEAAKPSGDHLENGGSCTQGPLRLSVIRYFLLQS